MPIARSRILHSQEYGHPLAARAKGEGTNDDRLTVLQSNTLEVKIKLPRRWLVNRKGLHEEVLAEHLGFHVQVLCQRLE